MTALIAEPAAVALARQALEDLERLRGQDATPLDRAAEHLADAVRALLDSETEMVTEYGVKAWSRAFGCHHVDICRDLHEALSALGYTRHNLNATALLVARQSPARLPAGEWRAVQPEDAIQLEASR